MSWTIYFGDFWPLTTFSTSHKAWMAWQFDDPKKSGGLVQAFRRAESPFKRQRTSRSSKKKTASSPR